MAARLFSCFPSAFVLNSPLLSGLFTGGQGGWVLPGQRLHRGTAAHAGLHQQNRVGFLWPRSALGFNPLPPIPKLEVVPAHPIPSHIAPLSRWQDAEEGVCVLLCPQMPEEEAFCVFVRLMQEYRLRELFKPSMAELGLCIYQFEYMLQVSAARGSPKCCSSPWGRGPGEG